MKIGILVDSSAGLNEKDIVSTNIEILPLHIVLKDEISFPDIPEENEKHDIFKIISEGAKVTTSQASPGDVINKYEAMLKKYDHIVHITISENLSSMKQTAIMVANDDAFKEKVTIIEHGMAADVLGELALKFNKMISNQDVTPKELQDEANIWMKRTASIIIPGDLSRLQKGGRARSILIAIFKMLKTKLAIMWDYKPVKLGIGRTISLLLPKIKAVIQKKCGKNISLTFEMTPFTSIKTINTVREKLKELGLEFKEKMIPTPFVCHAGTETIAFIAIDKDLL